MMTDEIFTVKKCPNCNGYTTVSFGKRVCPVCKGKGVLVIDNMTGKLVVDDDNENKNNLD
jgi:RecJ-like exonuclease